MKKNFTHESNIQLLSIWCIVSLSKIFLCLFVLGSTKSFFTFQFQIFIDRRISSYSLVVYCWLFINCWLLIATDEHRTKLHWKMPENPFAQLISYYYHQYTYLVLASIFILSTIINIHRYHCHQYSYLVLSSIHILSTIINMDT